jgi:hypothetical protein
MAVFSVVASCSLAQVCRRFRGDAAPIIRAIHRLWNYGKLLPDYTAQQPRRQPSSYSPSWKPEMPIFATTSVLNGIPGSRSTDSEWETDKTIVDDEWKVRCYGLFLQLFRHSRKRHDGNNKSTHSVTVTGAKPRNRAYNTHQKKDVRQTSTYFRFLGSYIADIQSLRFFRIIHRITNACRRNKSKIS